MTFIIAVCKKTIVAFSFVVIFKRGRSLVIVLSPSNVFWPLKKADCPLVAPRVFCNVNGGNRIQTGFLDHAIEYAVGFFTSK